jgi:hypothetical protein
VLLALEAGSCLPKDTRPVPGSLYVSVTPDPRLLGGAASVSTSDGWTVSYDRFLISLGRVSLGGESCSSYYNADYRRVLDEQVGGSQKLGLVYAIGQCDFSFQISGPEATSLLGSGVSPADLSFMGAPGTDAYATNRGIGVFAKGKATKGAATKTFAWAFRARVSYRKCQLEAGDAGTAGFDVESRAALSVDLKVHGEALFMDRADEETAALRFDAFARADDDYGNGDGAVTLDELANVPLSAVSTSRSPGTADAGAVDAGAEAGSAYERPETGAADAGAPWTTLADFVYLGLYPRVVRFGENGSCGTRVGNGGF